MINYFGKRYLHLSEKFKCNINKIAIAKQIYDTLSEVVRWEFLNMVARKRSKKLIHRISEDMSLDAWIL
jgi:hypothetical protein